MVKQLRRVSDHVHIFEEQDHNDHVDNWKEQVEFNESIVSQMENANAELDELLGRLSDIVSRMRRVKPGDFYYAKDHNLFVDAWEVQTEINSRLRALLEQAIVPCIPTILVEAEVTMPASFQGPLWLEEDVSVLGSQAWHEAEVETGEVSMGETVSVQQQ